MPSISRVHTMPTVIHPKSSSKTTTASPKKERVVGFLKDPVTEFSRPVNAAESWALYYFEQHARSCAFCKNPYEVHRNHEQLCDQGHRLAQDVAYYIYNDTNGHTCSMFDENHKLVRIELPAGYDQVRGLLRAIARSLRHRSRTPFVSMDRTYYVAARIPHRSQSVKVEHSKSKRRPRTGEIVDWPEHDITKSKHTVLTEVNNSLDRKRGSIYEQDLADQRRNAKKYSVEVREPSTRDYHVSGYYR